MRACVALLMLWVALTAPALAGPAPSEPVKMKPPPDIFRPRIEVVCIDDFSVAKLGGWPFDRKHHARLVDRLTDAGARTIGFDVYFGTALSTAGDLAFAKAIRRSNRTWLIVNPASVDSDHPRKPLAVLTNAAQWRVGHATVVGGEWAGGIRITPIGKNQDIWNICTGMMADYLRLKRWPYATDDGEFVVVAGYHLPAPGGTFTSDPSDSRRLALDADSRIRTHSYWKVLQPGYPMQKFKGAIVVVGATAQNVGQQVIFDNWNAPQWTFKYHVEAIAIFTEKMLRHLRKPASLPSP